MFFSFANGVLVNSNQAPDLESLSFAHCGQKESRFQTVGVPCISGLLDAEIDIRLAYVAVINDNVKATTYTVPIVDALDKRKNF